MAVVLLGEKIRTTTCIVIPASLIHLYIYAWAFRQVDANTRIYNAHTRHTYTYEIHT